MSKCSSNLKDSNPEEKKDRRFQGNFLYSSPFLFLFESNNFSKSFLTYILEPSFRDDLISMIYILIDLLNDTLPWLDAITDDFQRSFRRVKAFKLKARPAQICYGKSSTLSSPIFIIYIERLSNILSYCYSLKEDEIPDYFYLEKELVLLLVNERLGESRAEEISKLSKNGWLSHESYALY